MAGRPPLRIGQYGRVKRIHLGGGVWLARCRFRVSDGVTRIVERRGPLKDKRGARAERMLVEALAERRAPAARGEITLDTRIADLVQLHLARLAEDGKSPATMTTYRSAERKLIKFVGSLRVGEATPARLDAAIRSM